MKVKLLPVVLAFFLCFSAHIVGAQTVINFDASGDLIDTVFGFQFDVADDRAGDFDPSFTSSGGAIPDGGNADWTGLFSTDAQVIWFEGAMGLDATPLTTGQLGMFDPAVSLSNFILSDPTGDSSAFVENQNYWVLYDGASDIYTITGTNVPIPSAIFLLGGGLLGLIGIRRKKS
jgi:hypothetical protein